MKEKFGRESGTLASRFGGVGFSRRAFLGAGAACLAGAPLVGHGQASVPSTVSMVVGFPPGGPNDLIARLIAPSVAAQLSSTVVVDNRAGADGELAAGLVAREHRNTGMLLLASIGALTISPVIKKDLPYSTLRDLKPVAEIASSPFVLVVAASSPYRTAAEIIAAAKRQPGAIAYASAGTGSPTHLAGALFCQMGNVEMLHVPYKGGGPALADLLGGQVALYFAGVSTALPLIKSGKLRAIGNTGRVPLAVLPDVPMLSQTAELKGYEVDNWYGVLATAKTPDQLVARFADVLESATKDPDIRMKMEALGIEPVFKRGSEFSTLIRSDLEKWQRVVRTLRLV